ncbi:MAG: PEP-CTERM sorting domain-containing protein [Burkholderiales bacterium]
MSKTLLSIAVGVAISTLSAYAGAAAVVTTANGANAAAIQSSVDAYRLSLGALNANVAGSFGSGRREINWDGVPDALSAPNTLPANFFNVNSPRGVLFGTPGSGFEVSANAASGTPVEFGNINASYGSIFSTFSAQRLFTAIGSNVTDVTFFVPGSNTPALTSGFGAIFSDVDLPGTSIQYFDVNGTSLGTFLGPVSGVANEGLSFLGARFTEGSVISRVRITSGNAALGAGINDGGGIDLVVLDDFIYGEPLAAIPEPETYALMLAGLGIMGAVMRRRRQQLPN